MEPVPRKRRLRLRYVAAGFVLLSVGAVAVLFYLDDDPVTRMPPKSSIPADLPPDVRKNIEDLYSPNWACRMRAAGDLEGKTAAIPFLVPLLGDVEDIYPRPEPKLSWGYAKEYANYLFSPPEIDPRMSGVSQAVIAALVSCGPQALAPLEAALRQSRNPYARAGAAHALRKLDDPQAMVALVPALSDASHHVRLQAVMCFSGEEDASEKTRYFYQFLGRPPEPPAGTVSCRAAIPGLVALLKNDPSLEIRGHAAAALGGMKESAEVVEPLVAALKDKDWNVCQASALALGIVKDRRAVPGLIGALGHWQSEVRAEAAQSLGSIADPAAAPHLMPLLNDTAVEVRRSATAALAHLEEACSGGQETADAFILAMKNGDCVVRVWAAHGAGYCRNSRVILPLMVLLADPDLDVFRSAATALKTTGADPAILTLAKFRPSIDAVARAFELLRGPRTVPPLLEALKDPDPAVRACAAEALGPFKAQEAFEPLLSLLDDPFPGVRAGAAHSLGSLGDRRAVPSLIGLLQDVRITPDISEALRKLTGQDFGESPAAWQAWWGQNKDAEPGH